MASTFRSAHFNVIPKSNPQIFRKPSQLHSFRSLNFHTTCKFRPCLPVIRASINFPSIKPIESDKLHSDVRNKTMDAVDACEGFRVTVGDVSAKAGINLSEAEKALQTLAADTNGFMEVSDEGDLLYVFPTNYRSTLAVKSLGLRLQYLLNKVKSKADYIVRVSFGTALFVSIAIVVSAIIVILVAAASDKDSDKDGSSRNTKSRGDDGDAFPGAKIILNLFDSSPSHYTKRERVVSNRMSRVATECTKHERVVPNRMSGVETENNPKMNFRESVFSFVFGDRGGQGEGSEEERWKMIGKYIASSGGVVTAEELAPFLDVRVIGKMKMKMDIDFDSYILPVLLRFDGQPEVDGEGNILYRFPSLQRTAGMEKSEGEKFENEKFFMEKKWEFSKTSKLGRGLIMGLAGFNLVGVVYLGILLKSAITTMPNRFISFVSAIFPLLQIYAATFFVVPLVRWLFILKKNCEIEKRNRVRQEYARMIQSPDSVLRRKLLNAQAMSRRTFIGQDRIVYSTEKDLVMQDYDKEEWDQRFKQDILKSGKN